MIRSIYLRSSLITLAVLFSACRDGARSYSSLVKKELASGRTANQLIMDVHFGMTRRQFYDYCWGMHNKGIFEDGANSTAVLYPLRGPGQLKQPASMNFYPVFRNDTIYKMWAQFEYDAWAPWNRSLFADSLMLDVVNLYTKWYPGNNFIKLTDPKRGTIFVKVDGNRRIVVGRKDDAHVNVDYTDLLADNPTQP
ncbi:MAG: hypothetical protein JST42_13655 [Bacteroidetes bacterium]|nr:hypothetical protein [Bacteroidota bacterium]